ncbi:hypothetical protein [Roseofilum casamattae]|uniref:Uncharacterized protein n=1 Tax=Roseofilum casamattae BLCC-M143 TaxID=3022442 RepID=A0ABT7BUQ2_9CYAN|nr:hypothetical protein [Roseofilum casamattae]MDJ1182211.1 hypothetical protein [Roseofilum casamattae BLCC-M143]
MNYTSPDGYGDRTDSHLPVGTPKESVADIDYTDLAIEVLTTQDPYLIRSLTDFLTVLPNPCHVQSILQNAVDRLSQSDLQSYRWIVEHSAYLIPYLDLTPQDNTLPFSFGEDRQLSMYDSFL